MGISWIICGGESGPRARPLNVAWIYAILSQCRAAGISCFVKQIGSNPYGSMLGDPPDENLFPGPIEWSGHHAGTYRPKLKDRKGGDMAEWPPALRVRQFPNQEVDAMSNQGRKQ